MRGDMPWPFENVQGFWGLIRKLEGHLGQRYDLLDETQLDHWVGNDEAALVWASRLDTSDDVPTVASRERIDLAAVLQGDEGLPKDVFLQFLLTFDDDQGDVHMQGWSVPSTVRLSFLVRDEEDSALAIVIEEKGPTNRQVLLQVHQLHGEDSTSESSSHHQDDSVLGHVRQIALGAITPAPPGQSRHLVFTLSANWTVSLSIDGKIPASSVVVPEELRDELYASLRKIEGVGLRSDLSMRRATIDSLVLTEDHQLHEELLYFLANRAASWRDAFSLGGGGGGGGGPAGGAGGLVSSPVPWSTVLFYVVLVTGIPLLVTRLASFDTSLIPTKGLDRPLLYFRLAFFVTVSSIVTGAIVTLCWLIYMLFHNVGGGFPSVVAALTYRSPEVLFWRFAVVLLSVKRLMESYLSFKTQIDKLSEKRIRVAKPLFDFEYWMWVNRVSLVADILETGSLLSVSLCSPVEDRNMQLVGTILFAVFHEVHCVAHFAIFAEIKRVKQDDLVARLRNINSLSFAVLISCVSFHLMPLLVTWTWLESLANLTEWVFFALTFLWRWTVLSQYIAPEDTRLYVGRRVALGAASQCSECFRPFSQTRPRESCADCRDVCCVECGSEVHMSELGSHVDMTCFFCNRCHRLLLEEVMRLRNKLEAGRERAGSKLSTRVKPVGLAKRVPVLPSETALETGAEPCRMFQRGECTYGDACKYLHILVSDEPRARANSTARKPASSIATGPSPGAAAPKRPMVVAAVGTATTANSPTTPIGATSASPTEEEQEPPSFLPLGDTQVSSLEKKKRRRGGRGKGKKKGVSSRFSASDGDPDPDDDDEHDDKE